MTVKAAPEILTSPGKAPSTAMGWSFAGSYAVHAAALVSLLMLSGGTLSKPPTFVLMRGTPTVVLESSNARASVSLEQLPQTKAVPPVGVSEEDRPVNVPRLQLHEFWEFQAVELPVVYEPEKPKSVGPPPAPKPDLEAEPEQVDEPQTFTEKAAESKTKDSSLPAVAQSPQKDQGADVDNYPEPLRTNSAPLYPTEAISKKLEGRVILRVVVTSQGQCKQVRVVQTSGHRVLDEAAIETVSKWDFRPAHRSGQPVEFAIDVPFRFMLN